MLSIDIRDKIIIFLIAILGMGVLGFILYYQHEQSVQSAAIQQQVIQSQQLLDNISRAQSSFASKQDLQTFAQQNDINLQVVQDNLKTLNATLSSIGQVSANSSGQNSSGVPSSTTTPTGNPEPTPTTTCDGNQVSCTNPDTYHYLANRQELQLNEDFTAPQGAQAVTVPFGKVGFTASAANPWDVNISPRSYNLTTTLGTKNDGSGQQVAYNQLTINSDGKDYNIPITKNQFLQQVVSPKFSFWSPRLYLGLDAGINTGTLKGDVIPTLNLGIMSYGINTSTPDWNILDVGVGYGMVSRDVQISIMPFSYNVAKTFKPLMQNGYIGPTLNIDPVNGNLTPGLSLRVGL